MNIYLLTLNRYSYILAEPSKVGSAAIWEVFTIYIMRRKKMKKLFAFLLAAVMVFTLCGCSAAGSGIFMVPGIQTFRYDPRKYCIETHDCQI